MYIAWQRTQAHTSAHKRTQAQKAVYDAFIIGTNFNKKHDLRPI